MEIDAKALLKDIKVTLALTKGKLEMFEIGLSDIIKNDFEIERDKVIDEMGKYASPYETNCPNYTLYYCEVNDEIVPIKGGLYFAPLVYFESIELAKKVIEEVGKERLKKYYFRLQL